MRRILAIGAHPDDVEIGCGGSLVRFISEGSDIFVTIMSMQNPAVMPPGSLQDECDESLRELGIGVNRRLYNYLQMRQLTEQRQQVLQRLFDIRKEVNPDVVFIPSPHDIHKDHSTVSQEAIRVFKDKTILAFYLPWNNIQFTTEGFIRLNDRQVDTKLKSLSKYESQRGKHYMDPESVWAQMRAWGTHIGCKFAEAYEVIRWVL